MNVNEEVMAKKTTARAKAEPGSDIEGAAPKPRTRAKTTKRATAATGTANDTNVASESFESTLVSFDADIATNGGPSDDEIRLRAYQRDLARGAGDGMDFDDWVQAEKELRQK